MQIRKPLILGTLALAGCVPGGPVYLGPAFGVVQGTVYSLEDNAPLVGAEVCLFADGAIDDAGGISGSEVDCVRTRDEGAYTLRHTEETIAILRFRLPGARPAVIRDVHVVPGEDLVRDCRLSTRLTLSTQPGTCRTGTDQ